jgi:hypothetical protein
MGMYGGFGGEWSVEVKCTQYNLEYQKKHFIHRTDGRKAEGGSHCRFRILRRVYSMEIRK